MTLESLTSTDAVAISDALLETTRQAYQSNDFTEFRRHFLLPYRAENFDGTRVLHSEEELHQVFQALCNMMRDLGVIDMKRRTIEAEFSNPEKIDLTFVSEYILGGYKVSDEVIGHSELRLVDGDWRVANTKFATRLDDFSRAMMHS